MTSDTSITRSPRAEDDEVDVSGTESAVGDDSAKGKGLLIEVDLSGMKIPEEGASANGTSGEQKNVLGFFFKVTFKTSLNAVFRNLFFFFF